MKFNKNKNMARITRLLFVIALVFLFTLGTAQAQIFGGIKSEEGEVYGLCLDNPDDPYCVSAGVNCDLPAWQNDPKCISQTEAGTGLAKTSLGGTGITHTENAGDLIIKYVNFVLPYLTLAAFVGFVVAGFFYVTAYGNEEQLQKAKKILIWSVVGLLVVIASYAIVQFFTQSLIEQL
jgi:hypothetical protein